MVFEISDNRILGVQLLDMGEKHHTQIMIGDNPTGFRHAAKDFILQLPKDKKEAYAEFLWGLAWSILGDPQSHGLPGGDPCEFTLIYRSDEEYSSQVPLDSIVALRLPDDIKCPCNHPWLIYWSRPELLGYSRQKPIYSECTNYGNHDRGPVPLPLKPIAQGLFGIQEMNRGKEFLLLSPQAIR